MPEAATGAMPVTLGATLDTEGTSGVLAISRTSATSADCTTLASPTTSLVCTTLATSTDSAGGHGGGIVLFLPPALARLYPFTSIPPLNLITVTILPGSTIPAPPSVPSKKTG